MIIDSPNKNQISELCRLWTQAFGDSDEFFNLFHNTAFSAERCRCLILDGKLATALYWFDCEHDGEKIAYIYAVATFKEYRGKGLCKALMENTHKHLRALGYCAAILVPSEESLFGFYERMGYKICSCVDEFEARESDKTAELIQIDKYEYAHIRRLLLPKGAVIQEKENLDFLEAQATLYKGNGFILAARQQADKLFALELLGDTSAAPRILSALGCKKGIFRTCGNSKPFAMFLPFDKKIMPPQYFGLAFD